MTRYYAYRDEDDVLCNPELGAPPAISIKATVVGVALSSVLWFMFLGLVYLWVTS